MSLFKAREWWATKVGGSDEEFDRGCLCVANVDNDPSSQAKIIVGGFAGILRIYLPHKSEFSANDLLLEAPLGAPIIQIECGRFVSGSTDMALAVLHPRTLSVYLIGAVGDENGKIYHALQKCYEHYLEHTAFNFTYGPFGGLTNSDMICVQSMDGLLTFYHAESYAFHRYLTKFLVPGPLCYAEYTDSFITFNSEMEIECYKYQALAASTGSQQKSADGSGAVDMNVGKRLQVDWATNVGEFVVDVAIARFTKTLQGGQFDIVVLGERNLYVLNEDGAIKLQKRLDYNAYCIAPYISTDEDVPGANQNLIIGTFAKSLMIYRDTQLIWSAQTEFPPIAIRVSSFANIPGLIVSMSEEGRLCVNYLGTDPPKQISVVPKSKELDYSQVQDELKRLHKVIRDNSSQSKVEPEHSVVIRSQVPNVLDESSDDEDDRYGKLPSVTVRLYISYTGPETIRDVTISISPTDPISVNQTNMVISSLAGGSHTPIIIPLVFRCRPTVIPNTLRVPVLAIYSSGGISEESRTISAEIDLPVCLICKIVPPVKNNNLFKATFDTNRPPVALSALFDDLLVNYQSDTGITSAAYSAMSFQFRNGPEVSVLLSKSGGRYRIQASAFEAMWLIASELIQRLLIYFETHKETAPGTNEPPFQVTYTEPIPLQDYFSLIDEHFKNRQGLSQINTQISDRAQQFRSIQKRLLVRFKDRNPTPLENLDLLLETTHRQIMDLATTYEETQTRLQQAAAALSAGTNLILLMLKLQYSLDSENLNTMIAHLSPVVDDTEEQGWEEVTDVAMTNLLRTTLAKSTKDAATIAPSLGALTDTSKLKKHIAIVCDRLSKGMRPYKPPAKKKSEKEKAAEKQDESNTASERDTSEATPSS